MLRHVVAHVVAAPEQFTGEFGRDRLVQLRLSEAARDRASARPPSDAADPIIMSVPWQVRQRGVEVRVVLNGAEGAADPHLAALLGKAHRVLALLTGGGASSIDAAARVVGIDRIEASRILPLAFLARTSRARSLQLGAS
ncbi:hypothetical protein [Acuticoccus sp.]|uniref:hypothetical protein n=1 Tax=Acuticoccus sp. TaxID=1904378 RepID=UPI003B523B52